MHTMFKFIIKTNITPNYIATITPASTRVFFVYVCYRVLFLSKIRYNETKMVTRKATILNKN